MPEVWRSPLVNHIDRLKRLKLRLHEATVHVAARHRTEYRNQCAQLLEANLLFVRPPEQDAAQWAVRVHALAEAVADKLFADADSWSLMIYVSSQNLPPTGPLEDFLTMSTVLDWVRAGREGDPLGKEFTQDDYLRSDRHIAGLVYFTILRGKAQHTPALLRRWIEEKSLTPFAEYLGPVLLAWVAHIGPMFKRDLRQWVREEIRK